MKQPFDLEAIVRPSVRALKPYSSARDEFRGAARIWLDANENPYGGALARYPDARYVALRTALARQAGCNPKQILPGNGSDELIDLLMRAFCRPGIDTLIVQPPTYGMYAVQAAINEVAVREVPLNANFLPDVNALRAAIAAETRLIFFCSPNNPTGNCMPPEVVRGIAKSFRGLVVVDAAYAEFADQSMLTELGILPNLVVLRTFSKARGLAGIRLGVLYASDEVVAVIEKIKPPYNVSRLTVDVAMRALETSESLTNEVREIRRERDELANWLAVHPLVKAVYPSEANFLLVRFRDAAQVYREMCDRGIVLRDRSRFPGCSDCLRITIGTPDENASLKAAFNDILLNTNILKAVR